MRIQNRFLPGLSLLSPHHIAYNTEKGGDRRRETDPSSESRQQQRRQENHGPVPSIASLYNDCTDMSNAASTCSNVNPKSSAGATTTAAAAAATTTTRSHEQSCMTRLFDEAKIKKILQRDPHVARLRAPTLALINTASALFVQDLVQHSVLAALSASASGKNKDDTNHSPGNDEDKNNHSSNKNNILVITMDSIQTAMTANPQQFQFLQDALTVGNSSDGHKDTLVYTAKRKRPSRAATVKPVATTATATATATVVQVKGNHESKSSSSLLDHHHHRQPPQHPTKKKSPPQPSSSSAGPSLQEVTELATTTVKMDTQAAAATVASSSYNNNNQQEIEADESYYD
jgi:hypothetical protein